MAVEWLLLERKLMLSLPPVPALLPLMASAVFRSPLTATARLPLMAIARFPLPLLAVALLPLTAMAMFGRQPVDGVVVAVLPPFGLPTVLPLTEIATPWFPVVTLD